MTLSQLPSNRPARRFYRGGAQITAWRGEPAAGEFEPEDWIASTTTVAGEAAVGLTVLPDGPLLSDAVRDDPEHWCGPAHVARFGADTKLLVKLLDAGQRLPVHAHPDGDFARRELGHAHGKAEAWYLLTAGVIHLGLRADVDPGELAALVAAQDTERLLGLLNRVEVAPGDAVYVPPGVLHAIGDGILLLELQEPEDLSILLEWRGFELDGARDGHLGLGFERALAAVEHTGRDPEALIVRGQRSGSVLPEAADEYFRLDRILVDGRARLEPGFAVLLIAEGQFVTTTGLEVSAGATLVAAHEAGPIDLVGRGEVLVCRPPAV